MAHPFPHHYGVSASASAEGDVKLEIYGNELLSGPPVEFGGISGQWSPETLFVGAVVDCLVLTFRAIAGVSKVPWTSMQCAATGTVDRVDRVTRFTEVRIQVALTTPAAVAVDRATRLVQKAEETCLVTRSLACPVHLEVEVSHA
jgi:organic hydroperoxide reductase OsmC/OhrA